MQFIAIILMSVAAAIVYGIAHDQVTARICIEYFTIGHPTIIDSESPTLLAAVWGIIATWWAGLILGIPLALVARVGRRPKHPVRSLLAPITGLLVVIACCALLGGLIGAFAASRQWFVLFEPFASRLPAERHVPFIAVLCAHNASYLAALVGGIVLVVLTFRSRRRGVTAEAAKSD